MGIGDDESGILVLPEELEVGQSLVETLGLDDMILDVSIYANRPDCMSMLGVAREVVCLPVHRFDIQPSIMWRQILT